MKQVFFLAVTICLVNIANAQEKPDSIPTKIEKPMFEKGPYITLQGGQVMMVAENKIEKLARDKALADGTIVMTTGIIKTSDGSTMEMKEGDRIYLDGGMILTQRDKEPMK